MALLVSDLRITQDAINPVTVKYQLVVLFLRLSKQYLPLYEKQKFPACICSNENLKIFWPNKKKLRIETNSV